MFNEMTFKTKMCGNIRLFNYVSIFLWDYHRDNHWIIMLKMSLRPLSTSLILSQPNRPTDQRDCLIFLWPFWFVLFSYDTDNDHISDNRTEISFWTWENIIRIYYVHVFFWLNLELEKMLFESSNNVCLHMHFKIHFQKETLQMENGSISHIQKLGPQPAQKNVGMMPTLVDCRFLLTTG